MFRIIAIGVALLASLGHNAIAEEIQRPFEKAAEGYYKQLVERKFDILENKADDLRKKDSMTTDGQPGLAALYGGVAGCLSSGCNNRLSTIEWHDRIELIKEWIAKSPQSVTAEVALIKSFAEMAWAVRGGGYANTVRPESWAGFKRFMDLAGKRLDSASPAAKADVGWYETTLNVGLAQGWPNEKFEHVYKEGIQKYPYYMPLYFSATAYYAPRWNGNPEQLRTFVESAVDTTKSKLGETMYARLNWSLWTEDMFTNGQAEWPRMKLGFDRMISDYPDQWNINNFAKFACMADDKATLRKLSKKMGKRPLLEAWSNSLSFYQECQKFAHSSEK